MTLQQAIPGYTPNEWATELLKRWGFPQTATNLDTLTRWANAEAGGYNPNVRGGKYNPLNIVAQGRSGLAYGARSSVDGSIGQGGAQGDIADFGSLTDGINATVNLFSKNKNAAGIIAGLRGSNQQETFDAINRFYSSWGGTFSPGGQPADTQTGTAGAGGPDTFAGTAADGTVGTADDGCPQLFALHALGFKIGLNRCQGRAWLGAAALAGGALIVLVGVAILGSGSRAGSQLLAAVPGTVTA